MDCYGSCKGTLRTLYEQSPNSLQNPLQNRLWNLLWNLLQNHDSIAWELATEVAS